jgi:hypothetical protein
MELGKDEIPLNTRMIVFKQKIITVENKKRRQWWQLQEEVERYLWQEEMISVHSHQEKAVKVEKEGKIKHSSQIPQNKYLKIFHQNIRGLGNKANELYCHLHHDLPHIQCLSEHHLSAYELQLICLTNYSLGANYCRKLFLQELSVYLFTET